MADAAYTAAFNQLAPAYDPQAKLINQQISQIDPEVQAQTAALDQAKVNAFRDITNQANSRGVLFSGVPIDQQAQYVGTKYLPAVANLKSAALSNKNSLLGQLNTLNADRVKTAQGSVADQARAKADAAYKNAQLQLGYARLNSSNANAAASRALRSGGGMLSAAQQLKQGEKASTLTAVKQLAAEWTKSNMVGRDGYISPDTYKRGQQLWATNGFDPKLYNSLFAGYRNPGNPYYGVK